MEYGSGEEKLSEKLICQKCGACCNANLEGSILLFPQDIVQIASHLNLDLWKFIGQYCTEGVYSYQPVDRHYNKMIQKKLIDIPIYILNFKGKMVCPFYQQDPGRCVIYPVRPTQCKNYPFLDDLLSDRSQVSEIFPECELLRMKFPDIAHELPASKVKELVLSERKMEYDYYQELRRNHMDLAKILNSRRDEVVNKKK